MNLPFSETAFLDVFGAYNRALWPVVIVLWAVTAGMAVRWWRHGYGDRSLSALLAVHWAWSGVAYHWFFFRRINPAAALFAGFFVVEAALFTWLTVASHSRFTLNSSLRGILGGGLIAYALIYPVLGLGFGLQYPRLPLFAVPCPTTLLTAGLLLTASGVPRFVNIVPVRNREGGHRHRCCGNGGAQQAMSVTLVNSRTAAPIATGSVGAISKSND